MKTILLCDIDGTLATRSDRSPFDWARVGEDTLNYAVDRVLVAFEETNMAEIIFISGRDEVCRPETEEWLSRHGWPRPALLMRPKNDNRKDSIVKRELYEANIKGKYNVLFVLDDRNQVVDMWRNELGLICLQVAEGDF